MSVLIAQLFTFPSVFVLLTPQETHPNRKLALEMLPLQARMKRKRSRKEVYTYICVLEM